MMKKGLIFLLIFLIWPILSGCPDKEKSTQEEAEQVPNTMEKATAELEQIITLLGGPMFDSRDRIEQLKNEQIQMLATKLAEKPEQVTTGSDKTEQNQEKKHSEKNDGEETGNQDKKADDGQEKNSGGEQEKKAESGKESTEQEKKSESNNGGQDSADTGEEGDKKSESAQEENSGEGQDAKKPPASGKEEKSFQFEDSLFGIAQWNEENWKMIRVLTDGMYFTWNNLQPQLLEKGITEALCEDFNAALETLSVSVKDKDIKNAQFSAYEMYQALADFSSYYKTKKPPEMQRITSMVTGIHFSVRHNQWDKAQELSNQLPPEFARVKSSVEDGHAEMISMLEISLNDLRSAVQKQDAVLVMIRTNLVTANIEELEAKFSQKE